MKALTGPSMYPGTATTTFIFRFLLCVVLFSSVHGNTYQQDAQRSWKNFSQIQQSANTYRESDKALSSPQNDSTKLSSAPFDENNIMERDRLRNNNNDENDDVTYSNGEYEEYSHPPSESKEINLKKSTTPKAVTEPPEISNLNNTSDEFQDEDERSLEQYDAAYYYYYEDYGNETISDRHIKKPNDSETGKIRMNSTFDEPDAYQDSESSTHSHSKLYNDFSDSELYDNDEETSMESSNRHYILATNNSNKLPEKSILIGEAVVSVVTTKSVVNGTISVPVTPLPQTTEQISSPPSSSEFMENKQLERHQTTENSIVLASVQTSRSISGARFLPFPVVEQVVQVAPNVKNNNKVPGPSESTESIIDKLDRVQSELSSGILSGGFRNPGNTLQLDVLPDTEQGRKSRTTTMRTPVISKYVPHRYNAQRKPLPHSRPAPIIPTITRFNRNETRPNNTFSTTAKSVLIKFPQLRPPADKTSGDGSKELISRPKANIVVQDVSAFLPPGYNVEKVKTEPTEKSIIDEILAKAKVASPSLLPADYESKRNATSDEKEDDKSLLEDIFKKSQVDISSLLPPGYKPKPINNEDNAAGNATSKKPRLDDLFATSKVDISALLPPGFKPPINNESENSNSNDSKNETNLNNNQENTTAKATVTTTKPAAGLKIVFPSRPGGRKPLPRITTPSSAPRGQASGGFVPAIHKGWPTRATTEFTGWPTSSTTPISIEKLLEAARTATSGIDTSSTPTASMTSSTTTTTTTTTTPRPTTPGICEEECELAGTIRLVGNTVWVPELLDSNTVEWKNLANEVENEIDAAFTKSGTLRKWYKKIKIDAFSQGSILVDYFVELNEIGKKINTQELKSIFHESLNAYISSNDENSTESDNLLVLGAFTIDPASTDFVVVPKLAVPQQIDDGNTIIPQWAIAVIVIGVGGLLFIIVFGVSVLLNRNNVTKIKPTMPIFDEEIEKNIIQKNQTPSGRRSIDYPKEDLYNIDAEWNDKSFDSRSNKMMVDGPYHDSSRYNLYDSWRSEWNGYYQNSSHASNRSPGYESTSHVSRHHPDYDTNF